ncbi:hypothetical protein ACIODW_14145 [Streptomyces sp. NPDC087897]|uniref:hypothetical protein n=1 Tax=Streptomyces sp. NPDC087897 TaxID=3365817 RepID=UPI0038061CAD
MENRVLNGAQDGTPFGALLLGTRVRAVRAGGIPGLEPEWAGEIQLALGQVDRLHLAVQSGLWRPAPAHLEYARAVHETLVVEPDYPPLPDGVAGPTWIQMVCRFSHLQATVLALAAQPRFALVEPVSDPLGAAVGGVVHVGLASTAALADDLERIWAARPADQAITDWEFAHLPRPVREQVRAAEGLVLKLTTTLLELWNPDLAVAGFWFKPPEAPPNNGLVELPESMKRPG